MGGGGSWNLQDSKGGGGGGGGFDKGEGGFRGS